MTTPTSHQTAKAKPRPVAPAHAASQTRAPSPASLSPKQQVSAAADAVGAKLGLEAAKAPEPAPVPFGSPEQQAAEAKAAAAAKAAVPSFLPQMSGGLTVPPFDELTLLLFGKPGCGKTALAAGNPGAYFLSLEPGQAFVKAAKVEIKSWGDFQAHVVAVHNAKQAGKLAYHTAVIDIVDVLAGYCRDFVCKKSNVSYPPKDDYGKTWREVTEEWQRWVRGLMRSVSVVFITHCNETPREITMDNGTKAEVEVSHPTFAGGTGGGMGKYLDGIVNAMGHMRVSGTGRHAISFVKEVRVEAKDRTDILAKLGEIKLSPDLRANWKLVSKAYEEKAKELGLVVKSQWGIEPGSF